MNKGGIDICLQEARYDEAKSKFQEAMGALGYQCDLAYNVALCDYKMERYGPALKHVNSIIEMGIKEHPGIARIRVTFCPEPSGRVASGRCP